MHRILERQFKRILGDKASVPLGWTSFLELISDTYNQYDEDRRLLDRSLELSSEEFLENNRRIEENRVKIEAQAKNLAFEVEKRTADLNKQVAELENVRSAMTNLLEDLEIEKDKLAKTNARDEAMLKSIGDGVIITDKIGRISFMNQSARNLLRINDESAVGKLVADVIQAECDEEKSILPKDGLLNLALSGKFMTSESGITHGVYYYFRKDKTKFPVAITVSPVILNGEIIGAIEVFRDITVERQIDKVKTEFVSLASHQLRTPLSAINWYIELLQGEQHGELNPSQKDFLQEIYKGSQRMVVLVNDLLNVSRLETGRLKIEPTVTDLGAFITEVLNDLERVPKEKNCGIVFKNINIKTKQVSIDRVLLRQVLENLLSNAINYSSIDKKCEIVIELTVDAKEYKISVMDNGIGIPNETQNRIFTKFYRADNAQKMVAGGNGLGLYLCKKIMESSGGTIGFSSKLNSGSTFYVTIPLSGMTAREGEGAIIT